MGTEGNVTTKFHGSRRQDWRTPPRLFRALDEEFGFTIDAAADCSNHLLPRYWSKDDDALKQSWSGEIVFCNPPYGRSIPSWTAKAMREAQAATVVMLLPVATDTNWWHAHVARASEVRFIKGRLKFLMPDGTQGGRAPMASCIAIWRPEGAEDAVVRYTCCPRSTRGRDPLRPHTPRPLRGDGTGFEVDFRE